MSIREIFAACSYYSALIVIGLAVLLVLLYIAIGIKHMTGGSGGGSSAATHGSRNGGIGPRN